MKRESLKNDVELPGTCIANTANSHRSALMCLGFCTAAAYFWACLQCSKLAPPHACLQFFSHNCSWLVTASCQTNIIKQCKQAALRDMYTYVCIHTTNFELCRLLITLTVHTWFMHQSTQSCQTSLSTLTCISGSTCASEDAAAKPSTKMAELHASSWQYLRKEVHQEQRLCSVYFRSDFCLPTDNF